AGSALAGDEDRPGVAAFEGGLRRIEAQAGALFLGAVTGDAAFRQDRLDVARVVDPVGRPCDGDEQQGSEQGELASHVRPGESAAGEGEYAGATGRRPLLSQGRFYLILRYRPVRGARQFVVGKEQTGTLPQSNATWSVESRPTCSVVSCRCGLSSRWRASGVTTSVSSVRWRGRAP